MSEHIDRIFSVILAAGILTLFTSCSDSMSTQQQFSDIPAAESVTDVNGEFIDDTDYYADILKKYSGDLDDELPNGNGTFKWDDHTSYEGEWVYGKASGEGKFQSGNAILEGVFLDNKIISGKITLNLDEAAVEFSVSDGETSYTDVSVNYKSGAKYKGEWNQGITGYGTMTFENGDSYTGEFANSKRNGNGVYIWYDGASYDGMWENDKMHGSGVYYFNSDKSQSLSGYFFENRPNGAVKYLYRNHSYTTEWNSGKCLSIKY